MGNLEQFTPPEVSPVVTHIETWYKRMGDSEAPRTYLGASILGHECERYLWYHFRQAYKEDFPGRLYRLFETGHREEDRIIQNLRAIGIEVVNEEDDGSQIGISDVAGHMKGHLDGAVLNVPEAPKTWHVLECKTSSDKLFNEVKSKGVKDAKPVHHGQTQVYMGKTGMTRALYIVVNKNTDEIYVERIRYDAGEYKRLIGKAERVVTAMTPPARIANRIDDFRCRFCAAKDLCWNTRQDVAVPLPAKSCRTCCHATPEMDGDGRWSCAVGGDMKPCDKHLLMPSMIHFAEPVDAGDDWIEFKNKDGGALWRLGDGSNGSYTYEDLTTGRGPLDATERQADPEFVTEDAPKLLDRYPPEDSRQLWEGTCDDDAMQAAVESIAPGAVVSNAEKGDGYAAYEFAGKYLLVQYPTHDVAVIWEGVE